MASRASARPDRARAGHDAGRPRPQRRRAPARQPEADQTADGVDDDVGGVGAPDAEDVLGHLQRQARGGDHPGGPPPRPRRRQQAEVEAEGDEEQEVRPDVQGRAGTGVIGGRERDELDHALLGRPRGPRASRARPTRGARGRPRTARPGVRLAAGRVTGSSAGRATGRHTRPGSHARPRRGAARSATARSGRSGRARTRRRGRTARPRHPWARCRPRRPETWADVSGVATHRAAAFLEP